MESCPYDSEEGGYLGDIRETRDTIDDALCWPVVLDEFHEEIVEAAVDKIEDMGCGDLCTPLFGRYDPEDIAEHAVSAVDLEQYDSGGYTGA